MNFLKNPGGSGNPGGVPKIRGGVANFLINFLPFFAIFKKNPPAAGHFGNFSQYFANFSLAAGYFV